MPTMWLVAMTFVLTPFLASIVTRMILKYQDDSEVRKEERKPDWNEVKAKIEERVK